MTHIQALLIYLQTHESQIKTEGASAVLYPNAHFAGLPGKPVLRWSIQSISAQAQLGRSQNHAKRQYMSVSGQITAGDGEGIVSVMKIADYVSNVFKNVDTVSSGVRITALSEPLTAVNETAGGVVIVVSTRIMTIS